MAIQTWEQAATEADLVDTVLRVTGTGASLPTKNIGRGVSISRPGVGLLDVTWSDPQYNFLAITGQGFDATTASAVAGYSVVAGDYNPTTRTVRLSIYNGSNTLADLAAAQRMTVKLGCLWTTPSPT